jgi:hypothetical protein
VGRKLRTVKGWMSWRNDATAHIVFVLNAGVSLVAGIVAGTHFESAVLGLGIAVGAFVALTAALFNARFAMIGAVAAAALVGLCAGAFGGSFFQFGVLSRIAGGVIGCAAFAATFLCYRRFVRSTTGAGDLEGRYVGTFNERDETLKKGSGAATVVVSSTVVADHDLRITGLVVGGVPVDLFGVRREDETVIADLTKAGATPTPFELLRGKAIIDEATLIVDLEGSPFGSFVFTGQRQRG